MMHMHDRLFWTAHQARERELARDLLTRQARRAALAQRLTAQADRMAARAERLAARAADVAQWPASRRPGTRVPARGQPLQAQGSDRDSGTPWSTLKP